MYKNYAECIIKLSNNDFYEYLCKSKYSDNDEYFKTFQELMSIVNL